MPKWIIQLRGDASDLEGMAEQFRSSACAVAREQDAFELTSRTLNELEDPHEALAEAKNIVAMLRSSLQLRLGVFPKIEIGGVVKVEDGGKRTSHIFPSPITSRRHIGTPTIVVSGTPPSPTAIIRESDVEIAMRDPKVAKALRIHGSRDHTWHNLSNVLEVVQSDVGGQITKADWATQTEIDRFTQTANSTDAIGDDARHGHDKVPQPKHPMTLSEADACIVRILRCWLDSKRQKLS
jgi:hypothetical protein